MRIAVNTRLLLKNKLEGIGVFTLNTLKHIVLAHPEHEFLFLFDRPFDPSFIFASNVKSIVAYPPARHPILWELFFQYATPYLLKKYKVEAYLSPEMYLPLGLKIPSVAVIHDLAFEHHNDWIPEPACSYLKKNVPLVAQSATRLATVSEYSKHDLISTYNVALYEKRFGKQVATQDLFNQHNITASKIDVVGCASNIKPITLSPDQKQNHQNTYTQGKAYLIYVGSLHERKNIRRLLQAFDRFKEQDKKELQLLIVGAELFESNWSKTLLEPLQHKACIHFTGHLSQELLEQLLTASEGLVFPSLFEGFGIPILEGFQARVPVLTSNTSSMPEVAGGAALLVDPLSSDSIAEGLLELTHNEALRQELIEKGTKRLTHFSWEQTAQKLWKCLEQAIKDYDNTSLKH